MIERTRFIHPLLALAFTLTAMAHPAFAAKEVCAVADVPGPIVLPDGSHHDAGRIRVCLSERLSPAAGLHETSVGGHAVGLFLSRLVRVEASADSHPDPTFYFLRTQDGAWILEAYSMTVGKRVILYQLRKAAVPSARMATKYPSQGTVTLTASLGR